MQNKKRNTGITLIALIVTIVVLIILAGVSINMLVGENGIITQAQQSKIENEKAEIIEKIQLEIADKQTENLGTINEDEFYEILGKYGTVSADETTLTTTKGNYELLISDIYSGEIESYLITTSIESWEYTISGTDIILEKYIGTEAEIFVPDTFKLNNILYNTVLKRTRSSWPTSEGPFANNNIIEKIEFGKNVIVEENDATAMFYYCENLNKVYNLPKNVKTLASTFGGCKSLESVPSIPQTVTSMSYCFQNCENLSGVIYINASDITLVSGCFNGTVLAIKLKIDESTVTYQNFNNQINLWPNVTFYGQEVEKIAISCWGDSLTYGVGGNETKYTSVLASLCKQRVAIYNMGVGGEDAMAIASRQGANKLYVSNFTIPANIESTEINIFSEKGNVSIARQGTLGLNPCYIEGVKGNIIYNPSTGKYYFTRVEVGNEVSVNNNTLVQTDGMLNHRDDLMILWLGTNNKPNSSTISAVISYIDSMIEYSNSSNYIVIGLTSKSYMPDIMAVNEALAQKYGEHFLDIRTYILENGLADAEITPTEQDETDIANGEIPSSLRSDDVHLNAEGYTIVGTQVYNKLISLGYIEE